MAELMQPVVVKIGDGEPVTAQNPDSHDVILQVGDVLSRDALSHVSVLVGQAGSDKAASPSARLALVILNGWQGTKRNDSTTRKRSECQQA